MPVKRRYRKSRVKRSRRMMRRKRGGADAQYLEKLTSEVEFVSGVPGGPGASSAAMQIHWNRTIANIGGNAAIVTPAGSVTFNTQFA